MTLTRRSLCTLLTLPGWLRSAAAGRIRVGCQTRSYGQPPRQESALIPLVADMAAAGYEGFETNQVVLDSISDPAKTRGALALPLIGLHTRVRWDAAGNEAAVRKVAAGVKSLGGTHVVISGTAKGEFERQGDLLRRLAAECRELGVRVGFHNHREEVAGNFAELRSIVQRTAAEEAGLVFDIGHAEVAQADWKSFIRQHGRRIDAFHIRDLKGERQTPLGEGMVDLPGLAEILRETSWSGWVIVEMEGGMQPGESSSRAVHDARAYMRKRMNF